MKYKSIIVIKRGRPEVLQVIENVLRLPSAEEARVKILAVPVCLPVKVKIKPVIMNKYPILEAAHPNEMLESGQVTGSL